MTITTLNRSYVPVTGELEEAIAEILKEVRNSQQNVQIKTPVDAMRILVLYGDLLSAPYRLLFR